MRGRPKKFESKNLRVGIRLTCDEGDKLDFIVHRTGMSRSEIVRRGIEMLYNLEKFRE